MAKKTKDKSHQQDKADKKDKEREKMMKATLDEAQQTDSALLIDQTVNQETTERLVSSIETSEIAQDTLPDNQIGRAHV